MAEGAAASGDGLGRRHGGLQLLRDIVVTLDLAGVGRLAGVAGRTGILRGGRDEQPASADSSAMVMALNMVPPYAPVTRA